VERFLEGEPATTELLGSKGLEDGWLKGNLDAGVLPSGEVAGLVHSVMTVQEIIEEMVG
jgi:hypothetical protein